MKKIFFEVLFALFIFSLITPLPIYSAEVLQVRSSSLLQIGDNNRTYSVRLSCIEINPKNEEAAISWLKKELPRRSRVNLKPEGSKDGALLARVIMLSNQKDIGEGLSSIGLAQRTCVSN